MLVLRKALNSAVRSLASMGLRRLVVEFQVEELAPILGESLLKIDSLDVLTFLRDSPEEATVICRVRFKDASASPKKILRLPGAQAQVIEQEGKDTYIVLLENKRRASPGVKAITSVGAYISTPYEIRDGRLKFTFLGTASQIRKILQLIEKSGLHYKVISLSDAKFRQDSPLSRLTEKQRKVLIASYNLGYYDLPKKISSEELAEKLNMRSSTFVTHRIKAEKRLLDAILSEK